MAERGRAGRSRFVPVCAIGALLVGALACLNPLPDDFPNDRGEGPGGELVEGAAGTGNVPGGSVLDPQGGGGGATPVPGAPADSSADAPDAGASDALRSDAGALDAGALDAGALDAGADAGPADGGASTPEVAP